MGALTTILETVLPHQFKVNQMPPQLFYQDTDPLVKTAQKGAEIGKTYFRWMNDWICKMLIKPFVYIVVYIGHFLRDSLYFPLNTLNQEKKWDMQMGEDFYKIITNKTKLETSGPFSQLQDVKSAFNIKEVTLQVQSSDHIYHFPLFVLESRKQINGQRLRLVLFSLYGNHVENMEKKMDWKPHNIQELAAVQVLVLKALHKKGYPTDSLDLFSLSGVFFEGLQQLTKSQVDIVPKTIILDRGLSSIYKVGKKLFPRLYPILYSAAYLSNWNADPENACLKYFEQISSDSSLTDRHLIQITAHYDAYFSGPGAYDKNFHQRLRKLEMQTSLVQFNLPFHHKQSHHAYPRGSLYYCPNSGTSVTNFDMKQMEVLEDALMHKVYSNQNCTTGPIHQSLIMGGNRETREIMMLRAYSIMRAFINQKKKSYLRDRLANSFSI